MTPSKRWRQDRVGSRRPVPRARPPLFVGASVGVTMFPDAGDTYDSVVARADSAMYRAKAEGRGRYQVSQPSSS